MISVDDFLQMADRLAEQYSLINGCVVGLSPPAATSTLLTGVVGSNNALTWTAATPGSDGNNITVALINPSLPSQSLSVTMVGTALSVHLATNGGSSLISTAAQVIAAVMAEVNVVVPLLSVANTSTSSGAGVVAAVAATALSGGTHGLYDGIIGLTDDQQLAISATAAAVNLDTKLTTDLLVQNASVFTSFVAALRGYFGAVKQSNLIDGFLTANNARVHQYFDQVNYLAVTSHLLAANVFQAASQTVGVITLAGTTFATLTLQPTGSKANVVIDPGVANTALLWTAVTAGAAGDSLTVAYVNPNAPTQPLWIEVEGYTITVHLATNGGSTVTTTAGQIITAVAAHGVASTLVVTTNSGGSSGAGVVTAMARVSLSNVNTAILYTAVTAGGYGNLISVTYVVSGMGTSLTVSVTGLAITVNVATDGSGNPTSTAVLVQAAVVASAAASALVTAALVSTGLNVVSAVSATFLSGGAVPVLSGLVPLGTGNGQAGPANYAAQPFSVAVTPAISDATITVYPSTAKAFVVITPPGSNNVIQYTAVTGGVGGNAITITYVYTQVPSTSLTVSVVGNAITVTLATNSASAATSTAAQVVTAVNGSGSASALVVALSIGGSGGVIGANVGPVGLTNTRTKLLYTAVTSGTGGNAITITYVVSGTNTSLTVGVVSNAITVNVATDGSGHPTSTANQVLTAVLGSGAAVTLVTPSLPAGGFGDGVVAAFAATNLTGGDGPNLANNTTLLLTLLRSDLVSVVRPVSYTSGATPGTIDVLAAVAATLTTGTIGANNEILYTAVTAGVAGNAIMIVYANPLTEEAAISVSVVGTVITVNLATDTSGNVYSTALDVITAVNGSGPASALVTASAVGFSYGGVSVQTSTALTGGSAQEMYFGLTAASLTVGGSPGDVYTVSQTVERAITL